MSDQEFTQPAGSVSQRDLTQEQTEALRARIQAARNPEALKQIGDELIALTGYGSSHTLSTHGLAHAFRYSGLEHASQLAALIDETAQKAEEPSAAEAAYHGYREALNPVDSDPDNDSEA